MATGASDNRISSAFGGSERGYHRGFEGARSRTMSQNKSTENTPRTRRFPAFDAKLDHEAV
jgi:hypothetical protein